MATKTRSRVTTPRTVDCAKLPPLKIEVRDEHGNFIEVIDVADPRRSYQQAYAKWHPKRVCRAIVAGKEVSR